MNEKPTVRRTISTSTSTKTWKSLDELPPGQREAIEKMLAGGKIDASGISREFVPRDSGGDSSAEFVVEFIGEAVTVNGRRYDSIDDVASPERERVQALSASFGKGGNIMEIFDDAFGESGMQGTPPAGAARPEAAPPAAPGRDMPSPGAVPPSSATRRLGWLLLVIVCVAVAWIVVRELNQP